MRLGIMQPYFFPNLAHFALIAACDKWIVFDVTQYTKKSWISRNRILHPNDSWHYISVPVVKSSIQLKIHEVRLSDPGAFRQSMLGKISHYRKTAPHYRSVVALIDDVFEKLEGDALVDFNVSSLTSVCEYLSIDFDFEVCSGMDFDFPREMGPGDWAPFISRQVKADTYINPAGGRELFSLSDFLDHGIDLEFSEFGEFVYPTPGFDFVAGLSILDVLMWNEPEAIRKAMKDHQKILSGTAA